MVLERLRRILTRSHEGPAAVSPEQAELRLKALKARLTRNKSEAKRLFSQTEKSATLSPEKRQANKARLKELDAERKKLRAEMKVLRKRVPKK